MSRPVTLPNTGETRAYEDHRTRILLITCHRLGGTLNPARLVKLAQEAGTSISVIHSMLNGTWVRKTIPAYVKRIEEITGIEVERWEELHRLRQRAEDKIREMKALAAQERE